MTCVRCGETKKERAVHTFRRTIAGCAFGAEIAVDACTRCGHTHVPLSLLLAFDRAVAADLARRGPVSGETFRFIRKAIPLQPIEVSRMLSVSLDTVSRWEANRREIDLPSWLVIATVALDTFEGPSPLLPRLDALRGPVRSERIVAVAQQTKRTLREVLELASGPVVLTDVDIAEALDVSPTAVRTRFEELSAAGLVYKKEVHPSGAIRWEPSRGDAATLEGLAHAAGVDLDVGLPPGAAVAPDPGPTSPPGDRVVPMSWRAST